MTTDRDAIVARVRSLRPALAESGVTHVAMYGSRARGDNREDSDLDLLVDVEGGRTFSLLDLIGIEHAIADEIGLAVAVTMRRSLSPDFRTAIAADTVEIF